MQLSNRLAAIAAYVPKGSRVIDVGTDHAYIPIYLRKQQIAASCLATDINKGPIDKAKKNIDAYSVDNIRLKQTNGLVGLEDEEADVIMISGMGGFLIVEILKRSLPLVKRMKKLILQPQQDIDEVRHCLHEIGYKIEDETFVYDEEKYYTIISAVPGEENAYSVLDYIYGKCLIAKKDPVFKQWVDYKLAKQQNIYTAIAHQETESAARRRVELEEEINQLKEVKACLN